VSIDPIGWHVLIDAVVYRLYDADDQLLYVGKTRRLRQRLLRHRREAEWWPQVVSIQIEPPVDDDIARHIEWKQICQLAPLYNKVGNYRRGWAYGVGNHGIRYFPEHDEFAGEKAA